MEDLLLQTLAAAPPRRDSEGTQAAEEKQDLQTLTASVDPALPSRNPAATPTALRLERDGGSPPSLVWFSLRRLKSGTFTLLPWFHPSFPHRLFPGENRRTFP